ncbi:DNA mismatch repair protein MSH3 [Leucoagaricus sp. SymC.cos]|nr:DNA mismatch repair protein MSH3 [Leucoagaricus sp. SymC.cos]
MVSEKNSQAILSSYFSPRSTKSNKQHKRPDSPIDLTSDAEDDTLYGHLDEPPIKKIKVARPSHSQPRASSTARSKKSNRTTNFTQSTLFSQALTSPRRLSTPARPNSTANMAEQWAFIPQTSWQTSHPAPEAGSGQGGLDPKSEAKKAKLHEAFEKKFLTHNFELRPGALGAPDSLHAEENDQFPVPMDIDMIEDENSRVEDEDSDPGFTELMEKFSNPSSGTAKGKGKIKVSIKTKSAAQANKQSATKTGRRSKKPPPKIGPCGEPYTPLELQVLKLKEENPGTLLMIEVGYKYRFFGNDAKIAAQELSIVAYNDRNFTVAYIPIERLGVHLKKHVLFYLHGGAFLLTDDFRLLARGHRVGVVNQVETAALKKVGDNRNAPFERKLTHLYTATTYVDDLDSVDELESYSPPPFMCLFEEARSGSVGSVNIAVITICPSTGDVVWDDFEDSLMRIELETRLVHTRPAELLIPEQGLSEPTSKMLKFYARNSASGDKIRLEYIKDLMPYSAAFASVSKFYTNKHLLAAASDAFQSRRLMAEITDFPQRVVVALAHAVKYLSDFGLADPLLETRFFSKFTTHTHMLLAANTLINLEVYRNETDYRVEGSLIHVMDKTQTKFGARLLRAWIGRPLVDKEALQKRVDAVDEILTSKSDKLHVLRATLSRLPDLSRGLCRIQYGQCTPKELAKLLPAFAKISNAFEEFPSPAAVGLKSPILNEIIYTLPTLKSTMKTFIDAVDLNQASEGRKDQMWRDPDKFPGIIDAVHVYAQCLRTAEAELTEELRAIRKQLRMPSLDWKTHLNDEYLIEVLKDKKPPIPENWVLHSRTRVVERFHPASVLPKVEARARYQEMLQAESRKAYQDFLAELSTNCYGALRNVINKLAEADCLNSLARVASDWEYVKPEFTDDDSLEIIEGRHPIVEAITDKPYFSNSVTMGFGQPRNKIITGPNMGGKSSFVKMVALIVLMAQVGSYVPARSVKMGLHDSILTRMGASDDLAKGRSTFMVEMSETSDILHAATPRSLVILDELGRGTSTFDGMAIADGVLQQLVERTKCKTLFITHYPIIASAIEQKYPRDVENMHMGYKSELRLGGKRDLTFLYKVEKGITTESFGIECARLANMPELLLEAASDQAQLFQTKLEERIKRNKIAKAVMLIKRSRQEKGSPLEATLRTLRDLVQSLSLAT